MKREFSGFAPSKRLNQWTRGGRTVRPQAASPRARPKMLKPPKRCERGEKYEQLGSPARRIDAPPGRRRSPSSLIPSRSLTLPGTPHRVSKEPNHGRHRPLRTRRSYRDYHLHRPEALNAINGELREDLNAAWETSAKTKRHGWAL